MPTPNARRTAFAAMLLVSAAPAVARGQTPPPAVDCAAVRNADHATMDHAAHQAALAACQQPAPAGAIPTEPGQAAFGAIAEIVRKLVADPATDWSKVNIEALRQHLIDMDEVTLRSAVEQTSIPGGLQAEVSGQGPTVGAIRRMLTGHARMLDAMPDYRAEAREVSGGVRLVVVAENPNDARLVARIRGLGFAGLMTLGDHHAPHHLALARGESDPHQH